eukprot:g5727.t1
METDEITKAKEVALATVGEPKDQEKEVLQDISFPARQKTVNGGENIEVAVEVKVEKEIDNPVNAENDSEEDRERLLSSIRKVEHTLEVKFSEDLQTSEKEEDSDKESSSTIEESTESREESKEKDSDVKSLNKESNVKQKTENKKVKDTAKAKPSATTAVDKMMEKEEKEEVLKKDKDQEYLDDEQYAQYLENLYMEDRVAARIWSATEKHVGRCCHPCCDKTIKRFSTPENKKRCLKYLGASDFLLYLFLLVGMFIPVCASIIQRYECHRDDCTESAWTFNDSVFFVMATVTTIGYGNHTPTSNEGKIATVIIGFIGIPLTLACLNRVGAFIREFLVKPFVTIVTDIDHFCALLLCKWRWKQKMIAGALAKKSPKTSKSKRKRKKKKKQPRPTICPLCWKRHSKRIRESITETLILFTLFLIVWALGIYVVKNEEDWSTVDSIYYAFSSLSTVYSKYFCFL